VPKHNEAKVIQEEIARRASKLVSQRFLLVHYYRIRKRLALPLPITGPVSAEYPVRGFTSLYPWNIWLMWALEDRIETLGSFVAQSGDTTGRLVVEEDLFALVSWKTYRETARPDLSYAHAVRILWVAKTQWNWLSDPVQSALQQALSRAVEDALPLSEQIFGAFNSMADLLASPNPHHYLHNIPLIGTCALALAATAIDHPAASRLDARMAMLFSAILELMRKGFTEGVSYDGYVLTFIADWISSQDYSIREELLGHPSFVSLEEQVLALAAPGDVMETAPLGDVEHVEMPFVWSALAKLQNLQSNPRVAWALSRCHLHRFRADALVALARSASAPFLELALHSPEKLNYALIMRTGYAADDVAVAMGLSTSPMGHIHCDNGSLCLSTRGRWWLDDPGYQQYLQTSERRYTIGSKAHNAPVINGHAQTRKQPELLAAFRLPDLPQVQFALVDLTACYPAEACAGRVCRAIWLVGSEHLVVCDDISSSALGGLAYHWHGHPDLHWCVQDGEATLVSVEDADRWLHVFSPQIHLTPADLNRMPGSRGQMNLSVVLYPSTEATVWWVFSFSECRPLFKLEGRRLMIDTTTIILDESISAYSDPLRILSREAPMRVSATREGNVVRACCVASPEHFHGELEYAFYLMVGGKKAVVHWYTENREVCLSVPEDADQQPLEVRGFAREQGNPERKLVVGVAVSEQSA